MKAFIKKNIITIAGLFIGLLGGYLYWYFVGCANGTCTIQSSPWKMTPYGGIMGALTANLLQDFLQKRKVKQQ